jgi:hypothetical protein
MYNSSPITHSISGSDEFTAKPEFAPFASVVIPTYNEIRMIEKRMRNLDDLEYNKGRLK